jgi:hypothetical protein
MFAVSLDNLLFLLLIAVAALFQLLSKALSKSKKQSHETPKPTAPRIPPPIRRMPAESDADRIHEFLEALGQPPTSTPPPPVVPRTDIPPRPVAPVQPPTVMPRPWGVIRERRTKTDTTRRETPPSEQPSGVAERVPPPMPAAFEVYKTPLPIELEQPASIETPVESVAADTGPLDKGTDFKSDIATLLASKSSLRQVIILREIFGPPLGLQALDLP